LLEINPSKDFEKKTLDSPEKYKECSCSFSSFNEPSFRNFGWRFGKNKRKAKVVTEGTEGFGDFFHIFPPNSGF
jgi:hypothetical protein